MDVSEKSIGTTNTEMDSSSEGRYLLDERCDVATQPEPKDITLSTGGRWAVTLACVALVSISGGLTYGLGVALPELVRVYEAPRTQAAMVQSMMFAIAVGFGGILWTIPLKHLGEGLSVVVGGVVAALGLMTSSAATSISTIIVLTGIVSSVGMGSCYFVPFCVFPEVFKDKQSSVILLTAGTSLGQVALPFVFEYTISEFQLSGCLLTIGALVMNTVPCGLVIHYLIRRHLQSTKNDVNTGKSRVALRLQFKSVFRNKCACLFLAASLASSFACNVQALFIVDLLTLRGFEREAGSFILSMLGVANIVSRIMAGGIRMKMRFKTIYHWVYATVILALSHVMVLVLHDYWAIFSSSMMFGIVYGMLMSQSPAIMLETAGRDGYRAGWAMVGVVYGIGDILSGLLAGILKDTTGSYDAVLLSAVGSSLLMTLFTVAIIIISFNDNRQKSDEQILID